MSVTPIQHPAPFVPIGAVAFGAEGEDATPVTAATPLPVTIATGAATSQALEGSASADTVAGPFAPQAGRPIWIALSGNWAGTARLLRSTDGGATRLPLTVAGQAWAQFSGNANEQVVIPSDTAGIYYLALAIGSGTVQFRVSQ